MSEMWVPFKFLARWATEEKVQTNMADKVRVGLYGTNGHQIQRALVDHPKAELTAVAAFRQEALPEPLRSVRRYDTLPELLADGSVELVSLCSPRRTDQAADAIACLRAGKHVYAEKPCALTEPDLDAIVATADETGKQFHEMAGTLLDQPYAAMRECIAAGAIGTVVQILAQKSYPWHDNRPADEDIDGGLATQVGIYIFRFIQHIAGQTPVAVEMADTRLGNNVTGSECRRAVSMLIRLANGGVASAVCNYLNPNPERYWGYEILRVFGTDGIVESNLATEEARLLKPGAAPVSLDVTGPTKGYLDAFIDSLHGEDTMPLSIEDELNPTRWVIRAKQTNRSPVS